MYYDQPNEGNFGGICRSILTMFVQNIFYGTAGVRLETERFKGEVRWFLFSLPLTHGTKIIMILRDMFFVDRFTSGMWRKIKCSFDYKVNSSWLISLSISYEELPETRGDSDYYGEDPADSDELGSYMGTVLSSAGFSSKIFGLGIGYMYKF